jgi:hypothetical protein
LKQIRIFSIESFTEILQIATQQNWKNIARKCSKDNVNQKENYDKAEKPCKRCLANHVCKELLISLIIGKMRTKIPIFLQNRQL